MGSMQVVDEELGSLQQNNGGVVLYVFYQLYNAWEVGADMTCVPCNNAAIYGGGCVGKALFGFCYGVTPF